MSCDCYKIGGPFIAEDPDCEIHRNGGLLDQIDELSEQQRKLLKALKPAKELPAGEWCVWTSCSFRRISRVGGGDGDVLRAVVQRDGHPDLSWNEPTCQALCDLVNGIRALEEQ